MTKSEFSEVRSNCLVALRLFGFPQFVFVIVDFNFYHMALKEFRPLTPTLRFKSLPAFDEITKWAP